MTVAKAEVEATVTEAKQKVPTSYTLSQEWRLGELFKTLLFEINAIIGILDLSTIIADYVPDFIYETFRSPSTIDAPAYDRVRTGLMLCGKRQGTWQDYNGSEEYPERIIRTYVDGVLNGPFMELDIHGNIMQEGTYIRDQMHGRYVTYQHVPGLQNEEGFAQEMSTHFREEKYRYGRRHGTSFTTYPNGILFKIQTYNNDRLIGRLQVFHNNGRLAFEVNVTNGIFPQKRDCFFGHDGEQIQFLDCGDCGCFTVHYGGAYASVYPRVECSLRMVCCNNEDICFRCGYGPSDHPFEPGHNLVHGLVHASKSKLLLPKLLPIIPLQDIVPKHQVKAFKKYKQQKPLYSTRQPRHTNHHHRETHRKTQKYSNRRS